MNQQIEWRPIVGYEGRYEVSNFGAVRTIERTVPFGRGYQHRPQKELYQHSVARFKTPYMQVTLWIGSRAKSFKVHALVLMAFSGPRPEGLQARHLDGDSLRNHADNLAWGTSEENIADRAKHGRFDAKGAANPNSKLSKSDVIAIKNSGNDAKTLAMNFGVTTTTIYHIRKGATWKHLSLN